MYLKLGTTNIKYSTTQDDYMIFSEVIDSGMSYYKPVLVRTSDELDIWFGREFSDYDYFKELLSSGVTLFLYKPISTELDLTDPEYIDTSTFLVNPKVYWSMNDFPNPGSTETIYKLGIAMDTDGKDIVENYIFLESIGYVAISELPQNLDLQNSSSINNRDTLRLHFPGVLGPVYSYPKYTDTKEYTKKQLLENINTDTLLLNLPDLKKVELGYETLAFDIIFPESLVATPSPYIILEKLVAHNNRERVLVFFDSGDGIPSTIGTDYYSRAIPIIVGTKSPEVLAIEFKNLLSTEFGYSIVQGSEKLEFMIYSDFSLPVNYFYNIPGFEMSPRKDVTNDILASLTLPDQGRIEFYSKTIGTVTDDIGQIRVEIVDLGYDRYRIQISRYDYSETYEGTITGIERLDYLISRDSKLVDVRIIEGTSINPKLPVGTWKMTRATVEESSPAMYWKAIESIFNNGDTVFFDFLLVPDVSLYTSGLDSRYDYYTEYLKFLEYSKLIGCQVLIQNSDSPWKIEKTDTIPSDPKLGIVYMITQEGVTKFMLLKDGVLQETTDRELTNTAGNNYVFNYTEDIENRLVYFFRGMVVSGNPRPAYYLHILGLLQDTYSMSSKYILYNSPVSDPYTDEKIEELLESKKSNYLVSNNQIYYYKKYQNGETYTTTGWMRFVLGKISRELEKGKWEFLSHRIIGEIESEVTKVLKKIQSSFSLVTRIDIKNFSVDFINSKISLSISTYMSDLVDNNIDLDITLNYNK